MGETERSVRERFAEHYREALAFVARCPWDAHYRASHLDVSTSGIFKQFKDAKMLVSELSLPSRELWEAVLIANLKPQVTRDSGWILL